MLLGLGLKIGVADVLRGDSLGNPPQAWLKTRPMSARRARVPIVHLTCSNISAKMHVSMVRLCVLSEDEPRTLEVQPMAGLSWAGPTTCGADEYKL